MPHYTVQTTYSTDRDLLAATRPRHRDYLRALAERGVVLAAGPRTDDLGGVIVFDLPDEDALRDTMAVDPYLTDGVVVEHTVVAWTAVLGSWLPA